MFIFTIEKNKMLIKRELLKVISHVALALTVSDMSKFNFFTFKKKVSDIRSNFRNDINRWQISKSLKVVQCIFALALTVSDILTF